jgi:hypothetical protein
MDVLRGVVWRLACVAVLLASGGACAFSRQIQVTSEPSGASVWLANQLVGRTPVWVRATATGTVGTYTFEPQYVTLEAPGFERTVRELDYEWSSRNIAATLPLLGIPALWWGRLPTDLHVVMIPLEPQADR